MVVDEAALAVAFKVKIVHVIALGGVQYDEASRQAMAATSTPCPFVIEGEASAA